MDVTAGVTHMEPEKIIVSKTDEPTLVAEKLIDTDSKSVIFVISKSSEFAASKTNFKLLKREAEVLKKKIFIESLDKEVLEMAESAGLETMTVASDEKDVTDVVKVKVSSPGRTKKSALETVEVSSRGSRKKKVTVTPIKDTLKPQVEVAVEKEAELSDVLPERSGQIGEPTRPKRRSVKISGRAGFITFIATVVLAGLIYLGLAVLPKATVAIETKKAPWQFAQNIIIDTSISAVDTARLRVPGQLFIQKSSATTKQAASGTKYVERKATGKLTIYNAYSSSPQGLVVNTRFVTPSGVVFRLTAPVTVPGANIEDGKIVPSSITVTVSADKAGPGSNLGPIARLSIPGFASTPKYQAFYGELKEGTSGGFIGETKVPTESDIETAKTEGRRAVEAALKNEAITQIPDGFKVVDSATKLAIVRQEVDAVTDATGNFTVTTNGQLSALAFREKDILSLLHEKIMSDPSRGDLYQIDSESIEYLAVSSAANPASGQLPLPIKYQADMSRKIDIALLKAQMQGKPEKELKGIVNNFDSIETARIALWPFWVTKVPLNEEKIIVTIK